MQLKKALKISGVLLLVVGLGIAGLFWAGFKSFSKDISSGGLQSQTKNEQTVPAETQADEQDVLSGKKQISLLYPDLTAEQAMKKLLSNLPGNPIQEAVYKMKNNPILTKDIGELQEARPLNSSNSSFEGLQDLDGQVFLQLKGSKRTLPVKLEFTNDALNLRYFADGQVQDLKL